MDRLLQSEAKEVFRFFMEICGIPHGSGNVEQIGKYLVSFAEDRNLSYLQDETGNVIIIKEAAQGYEEEEPLILQGHMDMVAVKKPGCAKDMETEGLEMKTEGDWIYAEGTSLGGDDGIAVAIMLALLDSESILHPRIECIFTVDEETGMDGAREIDLSVCRGKRMLNLDSEDEGIFLTSCAGGARFHGCLPVHYEKFTGCRYEIFLEGLLGGHSGGEIHKERGNSNCLAGRFLYECRKKTDARLISMEGGLADNAIPRATRFAAVVKKEETEEFERILEKCGETVKKELAVKDPGLTVNISGKEEGTFEVLTAESTEKAVFVLLTMPNGVQAMSADIPGLVQTSLNLGILKLSDGQMHLDYSVRSSMGSEKELLLDKMKEILVSQGGGWEISGDYPAWEYKKDSGLREKMAAVYQAMYGRRPKIEAIHAGLECGILSGKISGLDCVSIGPDMMDIHTTEEKLSISSVERVWKFVIAVLEQRG